MIIHTNSFRYLWEVLEGQEYSFLFKDLVVVDLGCNVGSFSLWIYPLAKEIYAVDMDEGCIHNLRQTIDANGYNKIRVFTERIQGGAGAFLDRHGIPKVDVLKMDIEGDELDVVNDPNFPKDRIQTIVGEHHYADHEARVFKERLEALGYRYFEHPNNHFVARK